jgi:hypothetical protein
MEVAGLDCFHCGSNDLRLSRLRPHDAVELLLFRVPIRCHFCYERFYMNVFRAWRLGILGKDSRKRHSHGDDTKGGSAFA